MSNGSPFHEMERYLRNNFKFVHNLALNKVASVNVMTDELEYYGEYELNSLWVELKRANIDVSKKTLVNYLYSVSSRQFDPFKEYFESLPLWTPDEPNYLELLADTVTVPEEQKDIWRVYLWRWLIAFVGCAIDPTVTNQQVLVLVGSQGIGKTKWAERLVPSQLRKYFHPGSLTPGDRDSEITLAECILINLDELGDLNKGDLNKLKQLITQPSVRVRRPYAELPDILPRRASFIGSVNSTEFLRDETGNRRYLCVDAMAIHYNHNVDMNRVYAQAYQLFRQGVKYWFAGEDVQLINSTNEKYKIQPMELEYVDQFFEPCLATEKPDLELTTTGIQSYLLERKVHISNLNPNRLGRALVASKYERRKKNGGRLYYRLKLRSQPER